MNADAKPPPPDSDHGAHDNANTGNAHSTNNDPKTHYRNASDLPNGPYDIFIIPPHSSGSGFLYLPSLDAKRPSFMAGFVSALMTVAALTLYQHGGGTGAAVLAVAANMASFGMGKLQARGRGETRHKEFPASSSASSREGRNRQSQQHAPRSASGERDGGARQKANAQEHLARERERLAREKAERDARLAREKMERDVKLKEEERLKREEKTRERLAKAENEARQARAERQEREAKETMERETRERETKERETKERETKERETKEREIKEREAKEREAKEKEEKKKKQIEEEAKRREEIQKKMEEYRRRRDEEEQLKKKQQEKESRDREIRERRERRERKRAERLAAGLAPSTASSTSRTTSPTKSSPSSTKIKPPLDEDDVEEPPEVPRHTIPPKSVKPTAPKIATRQHGQPSPNPNANGLYGVQDAYSFRPYDRPVSAGPPPSSSGNTSATATTRSSLFSDNASSSPTTTATTMTSLPSAMPRGPYTTDDPDKIVIRGVYQFDSAAPARVPSMRLESQRGPVTDGLVLRLTSAGMFIDDDLRGIPQREWDVKAWTLKLVEVWCPLLKDRLCAVSAVGKPIFNPFRSSSGSIKVPSEEESELALEHIMKTCQDDCFSPDGRMPASLSVGPAGIDEFHILRATSRDAEGKRYIMTIPNSEAWKLAIGLHRLKRSSQARSLGIGGLSVMETTSIIRDLMSS